MAKLAVALSLLMAAAAALASPALVLDDRLPEVDAWPALTMLADPGHVLGIEDVIARAQDFRRPDTPTANLGLRREAVWLKLPLDVVGGDGQWVLDIDYPVLNQADVHLVSDGRLVLQRRLGASQAFELRPMRSRSHAMPLQLDPRQQHAIYLRIATQSAMVLPIALLKPEQYQLREAGRQFIQGSMIGVTLALLAYSLAHWLSLRDALFGLYAVMLLCTSAFFADFFGIAQQYLWSERVGLIAKVSPLSVLLAMAAGGQFVARTLVVRAQTPATARALWALSTIGYTVFVVSLFGGLDYRATQIVAIVLGPLVPLLVIPVAWQRAREGDLVARTMLIAWGVYGVGAAVMAMLLIGLLPANYLSLHLFQWATLFEMLAWVRVLALHVESVRRAAERSALEMEALVAMANSDALTGLPNRRGLGLVLAAALQTCRPDRALAVFLLDLDGFKLVNDRFGHDVGDELLVQVGQRLKRQLRHADIVARLGGDEFVVMAADIDGEPQAMALGRKLLDAFAQPFEVAGQTCRVGLTIGLAMAPHDGRSAADLLKRADAAMYAGKHAGRHRVHRGGASLAMAGALSS